MSTPRDYSTATLLPSGKVLVFAGNSDGGQLSSAELYDPGSGFWSMTGGLFVARGSHPAVLLPSGLVLTADGYKNTSDSELYNPQTGTWAQTSPTNLDRVYPTATLLPNGTVLLAGGDTSAGITATTEIYDPDAGTWSPAASMITARQLAADALLLSGRVLVSGGSPGFTGNVALSSAEIFDPDAGSWAAVGSLATPRFAHTATLLPSGKVLVAGGADATGLPLASAEIYDPDAGSWTTTGPLNSARDSHTATLLPSGQVLVVGGGRCQVQPFSPLASAEVYDPDAGRWSTTASMAEARCLHVSVLLPSGAVLVAGGFVDGGDLSSAELYGAPPDAGVSDAAQFSDAGPEDAASEVDGGTAPMRGLRGWSCGCGEEGSLPWGFLLILAFRRRCGRS
jgi:galactose oxidase-like protein/Kelch motif protein